MKSMKKRIEDYRNDLLELNDSWGFCERENVIDEFLRQQPGNQIQAVRYADCFEKMLAEISTPIHDGELLLGNIVQGKIEFPMEMVPGDGYSHKDHPFTVFDRCAGHCCPDYPSLLRGGLRSIEDEILKAAGKDTEEPAGRKACRCLFAECAKRCIEAIRRFADRYSDSAWDLAEKCGEKERAEELKKAAEALKKAPYQPAGSFREALQSVWFLHMILSGLAGGRDFSFGRMDEYLYPFYKEDLESGKLSEQEALDLLTNFMLKCNEFGGKIPVQMNYKKKPDYKPVPCSSTKQYLVLGGCCADGTALCNELSFLILDAALRARLPEPVLVVRMSSGHPKKWKRKVSEAAQKLQGQVSVFNDDVIVNRLVELGIRPEKAASYVMTGCNGVTFAGCQHTEIYHNGPLWLTNVLGLTGDSQENVCDCGTFAQLAEKFKDEVYRGLKYASPARRIRPCGEEDTRFHLESVFFEECRANSLDIENGGQDQEYTVHFIAGSATMIDSLYALDRVVYKEKRCTLSEFRNVLKHNFEGEEELRQQILEFPRFGNDFDEVRPYTELLGKIITEAIERVNQEDPHRFHSGGFYALYWQYKYGKALPATPDGRKSGEPISENMSPSYGADQNGLTALLLELSHMSLNKCTTGGLNVKFTRRMDPELCSQLFDTFFEMGGIHYAITMADQEELRDAKVHPERHRELCVRITGYSEFFTKLPEYVQDELIRRTVANGGEGIV